GAASSPDLSCLDGIVPEPARGKEWPVVKSTRLDALTRESVAACVASADELDVLLCLARSGDRYCSARTIAEETRLPDTRVSGALEAMAARNLLDVRICDAVVYRIDPASPDARDAVQR